MTGKAKLLITPDTLTSVLNLPKDSRVLSLKFEHDQIAIYVEGPGLPEHVHGSCLQKINPTATKHETIKLHWNTR